MKNKMVLGILIIIMIISAIFMGVNSAEVNTINKTNTVQKANTIQTNNKLNESINNETVKNSINTVETIKPVKEENGAKVKEKSVASVETSEEYITEDDLIYSSKYLVKEKVIYRIDPKTSIEKFKKNIEVAKGNEIKIYKGKKEVTSGYIGTGMTIKGENGQ